MAGLLLVLKDKTHHLRRKSAPSPSVTKAVKPTRTNTWRIRDGDNAGAIEALDREDLDDLSPETLEALSFQSSQRPDRDEQIVRLYPDSPPRNQDYLKASGYSSTLSAPIEGARLPFENIGSRRLALKDSPHSGASNYQNLDAADASESPPGESTPRDDQSPVVACNDDVPTVVVRDSRVQDKNQSDDPKFDCNRLGSDSAIGFSQSGIQRRYEYSKLSNPRTIRVLAVKRALYRDATESKQLLYSLETISLDDNIHYESVSYVWGDNHLGKWLVLDDGSFILMTASLAEALPRLAKASITGLLWIDQLCIDQGELAERNHQIKIMGEIYRRSMRVLIFLSHHQPDLHHLLPLFGYATNIEAGRLTPEYLEDQISTSSDVMWEGTIHSSAHLRWKAIVRLLAHPWFTRAWVFQEAVLAPIAVFLIRDQIIPFDVMFRLAFTVNRIEIKYLKLWREGNCVSLASGYDHLYAMARLRRNLSRGVKEQNFWELLSDIAPTSNCSIPVDIMYAFLGLLDDGAIQLEPDYSYTVTQVFIATARAVIVGRKSLDIFGFLEREEGNRAHKAISWVPQWRDFATVVPLWSPSKPSPFDAAKGRPFDGCENGLLSRLLSVKGAIIDMVVAVASPFVSTEHWSRRPPVVFLNLAKIGEELTDTAGKSFEHCRDKRRLLRVALADGLLELDQAKDPTAEQPTSSEIITQLLSAYEALERSVVVVATEERHLCYLARIAFNRRICVTEKGRLALAPLATKVGDAFAVLHGSKVPLVLRQQRGDSTYAAIGQAYCEGVMYGEEVDWALDAAMACVLT